MTGSEEFKIMGQKLRAGVTPRKKAIDEMTSGELEEAEQRLKVWAAQKGYDLSQPYSAIQDDEDKMRVYKYQIYALPRINDFKRHREVEESLS